MDIFYVGHSCFQLKGKKGTVVTDPYQTSVGFSLPTLSADIVTVSHQHHDHNATDKVGGTARRERPFLITQPGEYEVGGISVFGVSTFHDANQGVERGANTVFTILLDDLRVCHLGDLGHELTNEQLEAIGAVDIVLCPVGGTFTIDPAQAVSVIHALEPSYVIPMHYQTPEHDPKLFGDLKTLENFLQEYGMDAPAQPKLHVEKTSLPEETELVVLSSK